MDNLPFLNIDNPNTAFREISRRIEVLNDGFSAILSDYQYHINSNSKVKSITIDLRDNTNYRLFCAKLHFELLLRQRLELFNTITKEYNKNPNILLNEHWPVNPLLRYCERCVSAIYDDIIYHLASIYDYLAALICFMLESRSSITKSSQLVKSCRDKNHKYSEKKISEIILEENVAFVDKLYQHRSRLIHEKADLHHVSVGMNLKKGPANINLITSEKTISKFTHLKELSKSYRVSTDVSIEWFINRTIDSIKAFMLALRNEMESNSTFPKHVGLNDVVTLYVDPITKVGQSPSFLYWKKFEENIDKK